MESNDVRPSRLIRWLLLIAGMALIMGFLFFAQAVSPSLGGPAGEVYQNNLQREIDATALFYSESSSVADYLDKSNGEYGFELDMSGQLK